MGSKLLSVMHFAAAIAWALPGSAENALVESYEAPSSCPDVAWFEGELRQRLSGTTTVQGELRVRLKALGDKFAGTIQRVGVSPDLGKREVAHESCGQVVQALALIGALWLAPDSTRRAELTAPGPAPLPPPASPPETNPTPARRFTHGPAFGLAAQALIAPDVRVGTRLAYGVSMKHSRSESEIRLSWTRLTSGTLYVERDARAELTYNAGQLRVCEAVAILESLWFAPCALLDAGALRGTGTVVDSASVTHSGLWLSGGVAGKLEWRLPSLLFIEASAGAIYPFVRPSFHFADPAGDPPTRAIFSVPAKLGFSGDLLLGLRFP